MSIREATADDDADIARICRLTGAQGGDATGVYSHDSLLSDVYATPYLHGPGGFCLVWDHDGRPGGYVLGTDDTRAFQRWFVDEWWLPRVPHGGDMTTADKGLIASAEDERRMLITQVDAYPAHLHIDLLPEHQGRGIGRLLIEACVELLSTRGVEGLHLTAEKANRGAQAFYPKVGFVPLSEDAASVTFGRLIPS